MTSRDFFIVFRDEEKIKSHCPDDFGLNLVRNERVLHFIALFSVFLYPTMSPVPAWAGIIQTILLGILVLLAGLRRAKQILHLQGATALILLFQKIPWTTVWPLPSVLGTTIITLYLKNRAAGLPLLKVGEVSKQIFGLSVATGVVSAAGVMAWYYVFKPSLSSLPVQMPALPLLALIPALLLFSIFNAFAEEFYFRGLAFDAIQSVSSARTAHLLQALAFGVLHYKGFPFGLSGSALAFIFALMMSALRVRARGLFAPWLAHAVVDFAIGLFIIAVK